MSDLSLHGQWLLAASAAESRELPVIGSGEPDVDGARRWLCGTDPLLAGKADPVSGLSLVIDADGRFGEQRFGQPLLRWFDAEGLLDDTVTPFDGRWSADAAGTGAWLRPHTLPAWAMPAADGDTHCVLRFDDGDTRIADHLYREGGRLLRTINVVSDDWYLDRIVLVYVPAQ